ncbi:TerC/Alx family metal homeostasis membrane protein [Actinopolymorpha alba]|uniref:TerC/Alx family metal homeostasis membrane protein n=1 Tax=Actinopolymorpha alba TaxID=533267 RepID=UPI00037EF929|nr:TerC/Alx family metal homeostasis membrane protein [Actinopolymorpha alba]
MNVPLWVWLATVLGILTVIAADLIWASRRPHAVGIREAALWVLVYVGLAGVFFVGLALAAGPGPGGEFVAGYITEYTLSIDNLFVFVLLLSRFAVPPVNQHKVLLIGIAISLVLRAVFIALGTAVVSTFEWVFFGFGALLIYTAVKLALPGDDHESDFHDGRIVRAIRRIVPTSEAYDGSRLLTTVDGRRVFTPMVIVVTAIGAANVIFALDSIPAIFGLTQSGYIIFTANAFALMGLRQLYFLIGGLLDRLRYLNYGLAVILGFIGVKLILEAMEAEGLSDLGPLHLPHIGIAASLAFIAVTLAVTSVASLTHSPRAAESD